MADYTGKNIFEKIGSFIPGYKGYSEKEGRRDTDKLLRMERNGLSHTGNIILEVVRKHKNSVFRVIDQAEGFDAQTMDDRVGGFGSDTSGLTKGVDADSGTLEHLIQSIRTPFFI